MLKIKDNKVEKGQARKDARINDELKCIYEIPEE